MDAEPSVPSTGLIGRRSGAVGGRPATGPVPLSTLWRPAAIFAASRLAVLLAHLAAVAAVPGSGLRQVMLRWDAAWYLSIVEGAYSDEAPTGQSNIAFFPLYPVLSRGVDRLPGVGPLDALALVSFAAGLLATVLLWLLTRQLAGDGAADRAAALFAFAPGAFIFSMFYSEGLFLAAAVGACWLLVRRSYLWGGVVCALATATRPNGVALVAVAAVTALVAVRERREWRALVAPALAPLGFLGYMTFTWRNTGQLDAWFVAQREGWGETISLTARASDARLTLQVLFGDTAADWNRIVPTIGLVLVAGGVVLLLRMRPPLELVVYTAVVCGLAFTSSTLGFRPRFVLTAFPLVMALGVWLKHQLAFAMVLALSAVAMAVLAVVTSTSLYLTP